MGPDPNLVRSLLDRRVQVVAGKGGVGRTVMSCALALRSARDGHRTLLLEVNAPDSAAVHLGVRPAVDEPREVINNLWLCRMTPQGSLREYALMVLKFKALYALVFENKVVKYLLRSMPSLAEFTMLGKAWYHQQEEDPQGAPLYDRLVIDAPATGHALTFLSVARTVTNIAPAGIMRDASEKMAEMVESKTDTCLHVVCLPEEMPVNEGLALVDAARYQLKMAPGLGIVNRLMPRLADDEDLEVLARLRNGSGHDPSIRPHIIAAERRIERESLQRELADRFFEESRLPYLEVPDLGHGKVNAEWLEQIVAVLDRAADAGHSGLPRSVDDD